MGDARKNALRVKFDSRIKLEFHDATVTSDAGLIVYRELNEALQLTKMTGEVLGDCCRGPLRYDGCQPLASPTSDERPQMSMCPHARRRDQMDGETAFFRPDSPFQVRCRTQIRLWGFQCDGGVLFWCSNGPAAQADERYLGNVG